MNTHTFKNKLTHLVLNFALITPVMRAKFGEVTQKALKALGVLVAVWR